MTKFFFQILNLYLLWKIGPDWRAGCWTFLLTMPEVQLMVASSTPAGQPIFRFHAIRSPNDRDDDLPEFFFILPTTESAGSVKRSHFVLDGLTGILSVAHDISLQEIVTRNKGIYTNPYLFNRPRNRICLTHDCPKLNEWRQTTYVNKSFLNPFDPIKGLIK